LTQHGAVFFPFPSLALVNLRPFQLDWASTSLQNLVSFGFRPAAGKAFLLLFPLVPLVLVLRANLNSPPVWLMQWSSPLHSLQTVLRVKMAPCIH